MRVMRRNLTTFVAAMTVAGILAAPLSAAALHRTCMKPRQAACSRHSTSEDRCCALANITTMQPGVVIRASQSSATNAIVVVTPGGDEPIVLPKAVRVETSPPGRSLLDLTTLFVSLLV